jgi:flagellar hook-basal body complex protein FliE
MPKINDLVGVQFPKQIKKTQQKKSDELPLRDFGETISDFIKNVNEKQIASGQKVADVINGKSENLHEAVISMEESKLSFQLMLEIRNKLLESYKQLERMQV